MTCIFFIQYFRNRFQLKRKKNKTKPPLLSSRKTDVRRNPVSCLKQPRGQQPGQEQAQGFRDHSSHLVPPASSMPLLNLIFAMRVPVTMQAENKDCCIKISVSKNSLAIPKVFVNITCCTALKPRRPAYLSFPPQPNIQFLLIQASLVEHEKHDLGKQGPKDCRKKDFSIPNPVLQTLLKHTVYMWSTNKT